jgi:site-specific DNA-methyltransferase (adenine-specific)
MESNSIDAIVCDPPAGINFMQKSFDSDRGGRTQWVAWLAEIMRESLRVIKPGGHGLIWALPKTAHWTACALEDAGWDVREKVYHIFGQGFPKSKSMRDIGRPELGSALKPAVEEWILVRKPLSEPSIAANVLKHGVGGINVDVCRVATDWATDPTRRGWQGGNTSPDFDGGVAPIHVADTPGHKRVSQPNNQGRFPSHLLLSHHPACVRRGEKRVKGGNDPRRANGSKGGVSFHGYVHDERPCNHAGYADADGRELVADWECDAACPVRQLDEQAGVRKSGARKGPNPNATKALADAYAGGWKQTGGPCDASEGTVS